MSSSDGGHENAVRAVAESAVYDGRPFSYNGYRYTPMIAAKPKKPGGGEPKTDIFIRARNDDTGDIEDFTISVKKSNADMVETHMTDKRYPEILGDNWQEDLLDILDERWWFFESSALAAVSTDKNHYGEYSFTCGWEGRIRRGPTRTSHELPACVNEDLICGTWDNSFAYLEDETGNRTDLPHGGYAEFFLKGTYVPDSIDEMLALCHRGRDYARKHPFYLDFTKSNSFLKDDGKVTKASRYLVVPVRWDYYATASAATMFGRLVPGAFGMADGDIVDDIRNILATLGITSTCQITEAQVPLVRAEPMTPWQEDAIRFGQPDMDLDMLIYGTGEDLSYEGFAEGDLYDSYDEWESGDYLDQADCIQGYQDDLDGDYW